MLLTTLNGLSNSRLRLLSLWLVMLYCMPLNAEGAPRIAVLLSADNKDYHAIVDTFRGSVTGPLERFEVMSLGMENADALLERLKPESIDLLITVGTRATQAALGVEADLPQLSIYLPEITYEAIRQQHVAGGRHAALYLNQTFSRQFALISELVPDAKRVGVLITPSTGNVRRSLEHAAIAHELELNIIEVESGEEPVDKIRRVVDESDVILAIPDPQLLTPNRAKWLLYMAYRRGKPVIGYSQSFVEAGALGAVYTTPEQIGAEAADIVQQIIHTGTWPREEGVYPQRFSIAFNGFVARALGLAVEGEALTQRPLSSDSWGAP